MMLLKITATPHKGEAKRWRGWGSVYMVHAYLSTVISQRLQQSCDIHNTEMVALPSGKMGNVICIFTYL